MIYCNIYSRISQTFYGLYTWEATNKTENSLSNTQDAMKQQQKASRSWIACLQQIALKLEGILTFPVYLEVFKF